MMMIIHTGTTLPTIPMATLCMGMIHMEDLALGWTSQRHSMEGLLREGTVWTCLMGGLRLLLTQSRVMRDM